MSSSWSWVESQPVHKNFQQYVVIDAALGIVERGTYQVADAVAEQPWLPNGPIPLTVEWRLPGYQRVRYPRPGAVDKTVPTPPPATVESAPDGSGGGGS